MTHILISDLQADNVLSHQHSDNELFDQQAEIVLSGLQADLFVIYPAGS